MLVVVGAEGSHEFGRQFRTWAQRWETAARQGGLEYTAIGLESPGETADRDRVATWLAERKGTAAAPLWLVLIGHGTYDGKTPRFNLRGPDFTAAELAQWLAPIERPLAIINCASSSGPFLHELSGHNRVIITATRSGFEYNFARLGHYLSTAISDLRADLDKDEEVSLLEAFLSASAGVAEFYAQDGRLLTEHALVDDNGDHLGTPADWFRGVRAVRTAKDGAAPDGALAARFHLVRSRQEERLAPELRARRDALEAELARLRDRRGELPEEERLRLLEPLLLELAKLYEAADPPALPSRSGEDKL
jgi:hypothetical protein